MAEPPGTETRAPDRPQTLQEMFGGRQGMVDSAVPPIVFVAVNAVRHNVRQAAVAAVVSALVLLVVRLVSRQRTRHVFSGVLGVAISAGIAARSGRASDFFKPGIWLNTAYVSVFVLSVVFRKPIVGLVLRQFSDKPASWHEHPRVRRAYSELTLMWAAMYGLRVLVLEPLRRRDLNELAAAMKIALGYPPLLLLLAITVPYLHWRTAGVPVEAEQSEQVEAEQPGHIG
jgi:hypothetical protein